MSHDIVIRGARLVDGTGAPARTADIAVKDGRIAEIGKGLAAAREIDADGALATPGFVDLHTHYDGQVAWDGDLAPSSLQGVTTAVMGNCGVGFAPIRHDLRDELVRVFEGVEDIPGTALHEGMPWSWESYPEYLDAIDALPHAIDFASHLTHDALRLYVMGKRALAWESASEDEIAAMARLAREAMEAGAVGISTGRTRVHVTADGLMTPGYEAERDELTAIAGALRGLDHGVLQIVSDFRSANPDPNANDEFLTMRAMVEASGGHPLSVSLLQGRDAPQAWRRIVSWIDGARAEGLPMRFQAGVRGVGVLMGLQTTIHPLMAKPGWQAMKALPLAEQVARLRAPGMKARLLAEANVKVAGEGTGLQEGVDRMLASMEAMAENLFEMADYPDYEPLPSRTIGAQARALGLRPMEVVYDRLLEDEGRNLLYFPVFNYTDMNLDAVREMLLHPAALTSLSDGGAHVATICDASYATTLLSHWVRDRARGPRLGLEQAVRMLTSDIAGYLGFADRGTVEVGKKADLNIIDLSRLNARRPYIANDLPAGGRRFLQEADGYLATLVSGEVIAENGRLSGARPGRLVRAGRLAA
ncbi:MAG: amidohydrolase family protein [Alphaproteobacteria bacterium]|nr:amidohydrolase family protein [Alphaproteobacteria bacterium]